MSKRDAHGRMMMTVSAKTADILEGIADLSVWDDEELLRGQRRDKNGRFSGKPPRVVPQEVHAERIRRSMSKAYDLLRESTVDAVRVLREVMLDSEAPYGYRVQAADLILNRVLGKATERIELLTGEQEPPWLSAIRGSIVGIVSDPDFIDAEVVDDIEFEK